MSHVIWRIVFLVVPIALVAGFFFRPTPILGVDGKSLAASVGVPVGDVRFEPCTENDEVWTCIVPGESGEEGAPASRLELTVDWLGCWEPKGTSQGTAASDSERGCVTVADHVEAID